jgi:hypothetical protein
MKEQYKKWVKEEEKFSQFCRRMWLDHCDENKTHYSDTYTEEEYKRKFNKWLLAQYASHKNGE